MRVPSRLPCSSQNDRLSVSSGTMFPRLLRDTRLEFTAPGWLVPPPSLANPPIPRADYSPETGALGWRASTPRPVGARVEGGRCIMPGDGIVISGVGQVDARLMGACLAPLEFCSPVLLASSPLLCAFGLFTRYEARGRCERQRVDWRRTLLMDSAKASLTILLTRRGQVAKAGLPCPRGG